MKSQIDVSNNGNSILKTCRSHEECFREIRVYSLGLDFIPKYRGLQGTNKILLERIIGKSISLSIVLDASQLARMFSILHLKTLIKIASPHQTYRTICHIDTNPKNYLIRAADGKYFMIDFSESYYSIPEHDLVNFLLFIAASHQPDKFKSFLSSFLSSYTNKKIISNRHKTLIIKWTSIFDHRREKFRKSLNINREWQYLNRRLILNSFYDFFS